MHPSTALRHMFLLVSLLLTTHVIPVAQVTQAAPPAHAFAQAAAVPLAATSSPAVLSLSATLTPMGAHTTMLTFFFDAPTTFHETAFALDTTPGITIQSSTLPPLQDVSTYLGGLVNLTGSVANGDQWNDAVIAHEIGHWVMDKYADFPIGYLGSHSDCLDGNDNLQYSEAWANFFMAASRTNARLAEDRHWAAYYIDGQDDNPDRSQIGPGVGPGFSRPIEAPNLFDTTAVGALR